MKYMAIIDADEKPVSCEFIGCNGNVTPYLIGATTNIKELEQEPVLDKIRAEIREEMLSHSGTGEEVIQAYADGLKKGLKIIDKYKGESEDKK